MTYKIAIADRVEILVGIGDVVVGDLLVSDFHPPEVVTNVQRRPRPWPNHAHMETELETYTDVCGGLYCYSVFAHDSLLRDGQLRVMRIQE